jgi:hypothetical protein
LHTTAPLIQKCVDDIAAMHVFDPCPMTTSKDMRAAFAESRMLLPTKLQAEMRRQLHMLDEQILHELVRCEPPHARSRDVGRTHARDRPLRCDAPRRVVVVAWWWWRGGGGGDGGGMVVVAWWAIRNSRVGVCFLSPCAPASYEHVSEPTTTLFKGVLILLGHDREALKDKTWTEIKFHLHPHHLIEKMTSVDLTTDSKDMKKRVRAAHRTPDHRGRPA